MSNQLKIIYRNILENSTVTVTTENASFPKYRLYDRSIAKLFKGTGFASPFDIRADQGAVTSYPVDRLIIPVGHNLNGLSCGLYYSANDVDYTTVEEWTQPNALLISKTFAAQTKRYWIFHAQAPATIVELPEMSLGKSYTFAVNPVWGSRQGRKRNILSDETRSGYDRDVKFGELRRVRTYDLKDMENAQEAELEALETLCEGVKPFWVEDHNSSVIFMKALTEEDFGYDAEDGATSYYSGRLVLREVLGR